VREVFSSSEIPSKAPLHHYRKGNASCPLLGEQQNLILLAVLQCFKAASAGHHW